MLPEVINQLPILGLEAEMGCEGWVKFFVLRGVKDRGQFVLCCAWQPAGAATSQLGYQKSVATPAGCHARRWICKGGKKTEKPSFQSLFFHQLQRSGWLWGLTISGTPV
ncbi:hypothetical protein [Rhodoferax sp.]|uniref:hypothetical protein n=1 Tax=Rhodoferax sp. TaxID=50421 RepID=UPI00261B8501|nr:hypothetical protein [Rhodoferax sp.]MDD3934960.1 hypothetical protein [Rhodoferax sp.]